MKNFVLNINFLIYVCASSFLISPVFSDTAEETQAQKDKIEEEFSQKAIKYRRANNGSVFSLLDDNSSSNEYSPWNATFFSLAAMDKLTSQKPDPSMFMFNYIGTNYRINGDQQFTIRQTFTYQFAGNDTFGRQDSQFLMGDIYLQYSHFNLLQLPGDIGLLGQFRWYLPTSERSRQIKQTGRFEGIFIFQKPLPKAFQLNLQLRPEYYFQSNRSILDETPFADGTPRARVRGNREYELSYFLELAKMFNDKYGSAMRFGHSKERFFDSPANNLEAFEREFINFSVNFRYNYSANVNFIFSINNDIQTINARERRKFGLWREDELGYALLTFVRF